MDILTGVDFHFPKLCTDLSNGDEGFDSPLS